VVASLGKAKGYASGITIYNLELGTMIRDFQGGYDTLLTNMWLMILRSGPHEGRVDPEVEVSQKWFSVLDTPEHVDSEKLNRQISYPPYLDRFFSKRDLNS
jgi:hypothetical protein